MFKDFKLEIKLFFIVALIAVVVSVAGILLLRSIPIPLNPNIPSSNQFVDGQEVTIQGRILENNRGCIQDNGETICISNGPVDFLLQVEGKEIKVTYHYGEWPRCINNEVALQVEQLKEGDEVEVFAKVVSENEVSTCDTEVYYVKKVGVSSDIDTSTWQTYRNEEFGFEVRYPEDWTSRLVSQTFVSPMHSSFAIQNTKNETQWINILIGKEINEISPHNPISKWIIDGIPARQFSVQLIPPNIGAPPPGTKLNFPIHPGLWVEKDGMFYAFVFYGTEGIVGIYDKILSTFRFVE